MLKHTLILPDKAADGALAAKLLQSAIDALDVVLMLVYGSDATSSRIVDWADQLCNKTQIDDTNLRRVVWIRNPDAKEVQAILADVVTAKSPRVVVLDFHDQAKATLRDSDDIDPIALEKAFLKGQA